MKCFRFCCLSSSSILILLLSSTSTLAEAANNKPNIQPSITKTSSTKKIRKKHAPKNVTQNQPEHISVSAKHQSSGGGMMVLHKTGKTVSTFTSQYIAQLSPTATVSDIIAAAPGVVTASDGTGTTSFQYFNIRGMNSSEIGVLLEGMPASNAFTYSAYTPSLIDPQNMGSISVTPGSVDTNAAVYNATGGQISITLKKPSNKKSVFVSASGGSFNTEKEFVRIDTGEIGHSGVRAFVSASHQGADLWRGYGSSKRWHVDAALTKEWSSHSNTEVLFGWNQSQQSEWIYPNLSQWQSKGIHYGLDNNPSGTSYYKYNTKDSTAFYGTIKQHVDFNQALSLDAQAYSIFFSGPYNYGVSVPSQTYTGTTKNPNNAFSNRGMIPTSTGGLAYEYEPWTSQDSGLELTGTWKHDFNTLKFGYWYSYDVSSTQTRYLPVTGNGTVSSVPLATMGNYLMSDNSNGLQQVNQLSIDDKMEFFHKKLTIDAGLRVAMINRQATMDLPGATPRKGINNIFVPSPQALITYRFNDQHQIYVNATTGYHVPATLATQVPYYNISMTKGGNSNLASTPMQGFKPEYMIGEEVGYRYNGLFMLNAAGFHYSLTNHQLSSLVAANGCDSTACMTSQTINAGGLEAYGAQIELATHPWHHFSTYFTGSYLHTSVSNNMSTTGDYLPTKGKQTVGAPQFIGTIGLSYDDGMTFGRFNLHYMGKQYSTFVNDQSIPGYFTADISLGRRLPKFWRISPALTLNLMNAGNNHYLSYIYSYSNTAQGTTGLKGTSIKGSAPTYGIGQGFAAIVGLSGTFE